MPIYLTDAVVICNINALIFIKTALSIKGSIKPENFNRCSFYLL